MKITIKQLDSLREKVITKHAEMMAASELYHDYQNNGFACPEAIQKAKLDFGKKFKIWCQADNEYRQAVILK